MGSYVLAIDIERSGATNQYQTIAIGAAVVDQDFNLCDTLFVTNYRNESTIFEPRCWDEFWSKHQDILAELEYTGTLSMDEQECNMIRCLMEFRKKWETTAQQEGKKYYFISDNPIYDGSFVNELINRHLSDDFMPIPYNAGDKKYSSFFDVHSMQRGYLRHADPSFDSNWGLFEKMTNFINAPAMTMTHDHHPAHDAYTIAYEFQTMM